MDDESQLAQRKRTKSSPSTQSSTTSERRNVRSISAGQGLSNLGESLVKVVEGVLSRKSNSSSSQSSASNTSSIEDVEAIGIIERNEGLSFDELDAACDVIMTNPKVGRMYLALSNPTARTRFIRKRIDEYHGLDQQTNASTVTIA
jgi:hypothetical protein